VGVCDFGWVSVLSARIEFEELISVLIAEHAEMKRELAEVRQAATRRDFLSAPRQLRELDRLFKQHIADEGAQVLRILIDAYGVKGADDAITVFRQHRPIYDLPGGGEPCLSGSSIDLQGTQRRRLIGEALAHRTAASPRTAWGLS
jgi:hypothetical protein